MPKETLIEFLERTVLQSGIPFDKSVLDSKRKRNIANNGRVNDNPADKVA
jgi:hypothetical protein